MCRNYFSGECVLLFYDFNINFKMRREKFIEQQKAKGHFINYIRELNDVLGMMRMEEDMQAFIYQESAGKYNMIASIDQLQKPTAEKIQKFLSELLEIRNLLREEVNRRGKV